jgi:tetratricopeptide (TPR) repeat protein
MASPPPIAQQVLDNTKAAFARDLPLNDDLEPGTFFDDPTYFDSLPRDAKVLICAIQAAGDDPDRPGFCHIKSEMALASYLQTKTDDGLTKAMALEAMSLRYLPSQHPGRGKSNHHMGRLFQQEWELTGRPGALDQTIKHYRLAVQHAAEVDAVLCAWVCDLAVMVNKRYVRQHQPADLEEAGRCYDRALTLVGESPNRAVLLSNKGDFLRMTSREGEPHHAARISDAVACQEEALNLCNQYLALPFKPRLPYGMIHRNAAQAYLAQFAVSSDEIDIERAISMFEKAISFAQEQNSAREMFDNELAIAYFARGEKLSRPEDLAKACEILQEVIREVPNTVSARVHLADFCQKQAANSSNQAEANAQSEEAVKLIEAAVNAMPANFRNRGWVYDRCSAAHYSKYAIDGGLPDLDRAIECLRLATACNDYEALWNSYRFLGQCLLDRHEHSQEPQDLAEASEATDEAMRRCGAANPAALAQCKWVSGKVLERMYKGNRSLEMLRDARDTFLESVEEMPGTTSSRPLALNDLGNAYTKLFVHEALSDHLEKGIDAYKRSLANLQQLYSNERHPDVLMLNGSLGFAMLERYRYWRAESDLKSSISYYHRSMSGIDKRHPRYAPRAGNLSYALQLLFELNGDILVLKESQSWANSALNGPIRLGSELRSWLETHLGNAFCRAFSKSNQPADLENAVEHYDRALAETGISLAYRATTLTNKAVVFKMKAEITGLPSDFDASYQAFEEVRQLLPEDEPHSWVNLLNQANLVFEMYNRHIGPDRNTQALRALEKFAALALNNMATPATRINSASIAASLTSEIQHDFARARDFICISLNLLPEAILLHESRLEQMKFIRAYHYVPSSAAALSIAANDPDPLVIHRLEAGRANIWDRLLGQKTPVDALKNVDADLAERFQSLQKRLSLQVTASSKASALTDPSSIAPNDEIRLQRQRDAEAYRQVIKEIRRKGGFENFLELSGEPSGLQRYAAEAPIVFINASGYRSDALIITKDKVFSLPLPLFTMDSVKVNSAKFLGALDKQSSGNAEMIAVGHAEYKTVMKWLWYSAAKPILENINFLNYRRGPAGKPCVIWVSTGWISVLPIHAAGDFGTPREEGKPSCVHDVVVSSYTTSLKALSFVRQSMVRLKLKNLNAKPRHGLIVAMAATPGMGPDKDLDVELEIGSFEEQLKPYMNIEKLRQPDSQSVKDQLKACSIAHFACHALADWKDPSKSAILLQDCYRDDHFRDPQPFCVRTLLKLDVQECQLVYLSACETGANRDLGLRDEGVHIAGGFHMAGVPHVISTLWRVADTTSGQLSGLFYGNLSNEQHELDIERSADALHIAVQKLRTCGEEPMLWGPFIHSGP